MRLALGIEYNGSNYCGWQVQPSSSTVQAEIERGLSEIASAPIRVFCAGRTDTGVHAECQVVHFDTEVRRPAEAWVRGVNAIIPDDISVLWVKEVESSFHARYAAISRTYKYYLLNRPQRPGLLSKRVGWYFKELDINNMRIAASVLIGEHDFSSFRSSDCQAKTPIRTISRLSIKVENQLVTFEITANAFLHHMVRNIVGSLVYVGAGKQSPDWVEIVLDKKNRNVAAPTFSPDGLYLSRIEYLSTWDLQVPERTPSIASMLVSAAN